MSTTQDDVRLLLKALQIAFNGDPLAFQAPAEALSRLAAKVESLEEWKKFHRALDCAALPADAALEKVEAQLRAAEDALDGVWDVLGRQYPDGRPPYGKLPEVLCLTLAALHAPAKGEETKRDPVASFTEQVESDLRLTIGGIRDAALEEARQVAVEHKRRADTKFQNAARAYERQDAALAEAAAEMADEIEQAIGSLKSGGKQ